MTVDSYRDTVEFEGELYDVKLSRRDDMTTGVRVSEVYGSRRRQIEVDGSGETTTTIFRLIEDLHRDWGSEYERLINEVQEEIDGLEQELPEER